MEVEITSLNHMGEGYFDLVAIHGLYSSKSQMWTDNGSVTWLTEKLKKDNLKGRVLLYSYHDSSATLGGLCTRDAIQREALQLLEQIVDPLPLVFVASDFGGLIVKEALIQASFNKPEFASIKSCTRLLAFIGCPHRWNDVQDLESKITRFVLSRAPDTFTVSDHLTATLDIPMELRCGLDKESINLKDENSRQAFFETMKKGFDRVTKFPWMNDAFSPLINTIESQAAPVYPLTAHLGVTNPCTWLDSDQTFQDWISCRKCSILHVYGSPEASQAAEYGFRKIISESELTEPNDDINLYFKFDQHDDRRSRLATMATTFLAMVLGRYRNPSSPHASVLEPPLFNQCLTKRDAFHLLRSVKTDLGVEACMIWVVDRLDECEPTSRQFFLSQLLDIASQSDMYFKVLVTTVDDKQIRDTLVNAKCPEINLRGRGQPVYPSSDNALADNLYLRLLLEHSEIRHCSSQIKRLLLSCGPDVKFSCLMYQWLLMSTWTTKRSLEEEIAILSPPSPRRLFGRILQTVPQAARDWGRKTIVWALYSMRPLGAQELASALSLDPDAVDYLDYLSTIRNTFGPLLAIANDEIQFSSPSVRELFSSAKNAGGWYTSPMPEEAHREITLTCIQFLSLPGVQARISVAGDNSQDSMILLDGRRDITPYAIKYWPSHYRRGYSTGCQTPVPMEITDSLRDINVLKPWFLVNWYSCLPHLRATKPPSSQLSMLSFLGVQQEVDDIIATLETSAGWERTVTDALCTAARRGHKGIVASLLKFPYTLPLSDIFGAMEAAASSAEFGILKTLLAYSTSRHNAVSYRWPHLVLCRVAWAGKSNLLTNLLNCHDSSDTDNPQELPSMLCCAAAGGHAGTIFVILYHRVVIGVHNESNESRHALHAAVRSGCGAAIQALAWGKVAIQSRDDCERTALEYATVLGHHQAVGALLQAGAETTDVESLMNPVREHSSLTYASSVSYDTCVRMLLQAGANPNKQYGSPEFTALSSAADSGDENMCRLLLDHGAQVNGSVRCRPFINACESPNCELEILRLFVERGVDVTLEQRGGDPITTTTPLIVAIEKGSEDIVEILLDMGVNVNASYGGHSPLHLSASAGHAEIIRSLVAEGAELESCTARRWTPLHEGWKYPECLEALLDGGANIDAISEDSTVLYIATWNGELESVKLLISRGADIEVTCEFPGMRHSNFTPLLAAVWNGHHEIVRALLKAGANVRARGPNKETALHLAVSRPSKPMIQALLEYNLELDVQDDTGVTPLLRAINNKTPVSLIKLLVNRGAGLDVRGRRHVPLAYAISKGQTEIAEYLISAGAGLNIVNSMEGGPLHAACSVFNLSMVKLLISKGANVNLVDPVHGTPLLYASLTPAESTAESIAKLDIIRFLIYEAGADVTARGGRLQSSLHAACLRGTPELIQLLVEAGAVVNEDDSMNRRPIHYATFRTVKHIEQLLSLGADTQVKDKLGRTLLHTAVSSGRVDVVEKCLSITSGLVNEPDNDGWTPLLWAVLPFNFWGGFSSGRAAVIKLLLDKGADPWVTRTYHGKEWSALKLACYHGAGKEVVSLLIPKEKTVERNGQEMTWDLQAHRYRKGKPHGVGYCDACLCDGFGLVFISQKYASECWLCGKCYRRRDEFFPEHTDWEVSGDEFIADSEEENTEEGKEGDDSKDKSPPPIQQIEGDEANYWIDSDSDSEA
ncbi:ankyrin repeat-containing domain protein [Xylaria sp. FL1777]|nr:ankyrin repeat-containing domain protein [Xylaria sp. FL1777]